MFKNIILKSKKIPIILILKIIAIIMLLGALANNPYFYYQILRWSICSLTTYLGYSAYKNNQTKWIRIFGITAIFFNPIAPIHFGREGWIILDIIVSIILFINILTQKNHPIKH